MTTTEDPVALARRAEALVDVGSAAEGLALADRAVRLAPECAEGHAARARALRALGRAGEALDALDALLKLAPRSAPAHDARGVLLSEAGRLEEARSAFETALDCDPDFARAHFGLATLGRVAPKQLTAMEALARRPEALDERARLFLLYALAKAYDEADDTPRAFAALEAGAAMRRRRWRGDAEAELARVAASAPRLCGLTGEGGGGPLTLSRKGRGDAPPPVGLADRLIFVFGLPRSGTTLVEQILASHGDALALGETEIFAREARERAHPGELARAYLATLPDAARDAVRVVDKSLGSALHIAEIRAAFPLARLVHVRRDPLDVGLSCHFALFQHDLPFPPGLEAFGRYARAHATLMDAWGLALPCEVWREIRYEALVADPEREARALLDFVGLDWRPQCLDFAAVRREIRTASLAQAREAPHGRSVGRWRRYDAFLGPLRRGLEHAT
jgi:tetratricopeptide (TPR) repeat protein